MHRAMAVMRDQRPARALRMIVLAGGKSIVDDEQQAGIAALGEAQDQRLRGGIDLADVVAFGWKRGDRRIAQRTWEQGSIGERKTPAGNLHAAFEPRAALPRDQVRRHGVEHFVGDHQAAPARGQHLDPVDTRQRRGRPLAEAIALPCGEIGAHFEQPITLRRPLAFLQRVQQIGGQSAGARTQLDQLGTWQAADDVGRQRGQRGPEQRRHFRRGDEVTGRAELACACRVITQSRRIQHGAHVVGERNPAAGLADGRGNVCKDLLAVRTRFERRQRQPGAVIAVWRGGHRCDRLDDSRQCSRSAACRAKWS